MHCTHRIKCSLVNPDTVSRVYLRVRDALEICTKRKYETRGISYCGAFCFMQRMLSSPRFADVRRGWAATVHFVTSGDVAFPRDNASELSFPATVSRTTATFSFFFFSLFIRRDRDVTALISNINKNGYNGERNYNGFLPDKS